MMQSPSLVLWLLGFVIVLMALAPRSPAARNTGALGLLCAALGIATLAAPDATSAYAIAAFTVGALGLVAWSSTRVGSAMLLIDAGLLAATAVAMSRQPAGVGAWALSLAAIVLRAGLVGLHPGVAALQHRATGVQYQQFAALLPLVFVHLRYADHVDAAREWAPAVVMAGAVSALLFALMSLAQRELRGLLRNSTLMHGGLVIAAVGAAGRGHHVAALFVSLTMVLAIAGLTTAVDALEERAGQVHLVRAGGRARAFPRLAAAFAVFAAAGVGMPGTAGFIADDLILHALWEESVASTVLVVVATALLAVATLRTFTMAFFGPPTRSKAPDLLMGERWSMLIMIVVLFAIGLFPQTIVGSAIPLLEGPQAEPRVGVESASTR